MPGKHRFHGGAAHWRALFVVTIAALAVAWAGCNASRPKPPGAGDAAKPVRSSDLFGGIINNGNSGSNTKHHTVFHMVLHEKSWSNVHGNSHANYINNTMLNQGSHGRNMHTSTNAHEHLNSHIHMVAGDHFGITGNGPPSQNHINSNAHLHERLKVKGKTSKAYMDGVQVGICPLGDVGFFFVRNFPFAYFDDINGGLNPYSSVCLGMVGTLAQLATDLATNMVGAYNYISPGACNGGCGSCGCPEYEPVAAMDAFVASVVPMILNSQAYQSGGVLITTWDIPETQGDPIGLIVNSPWAKGNGYYNYEYYTHSSVLRSIQDIFEDTNYLGDAAGATGIDDLFTDFP